MFKRVLSKIIIVVLLIVNWLEVINVIFFHYNFQRQNPDISNLSIAVLSILFIFSIAFLKGIWKYNKWGIHGYWTIFIISLILCIFYRKLIVYMIITFIGALFMTILMKGKYKVEN